MLVESLILTFVLFYIKVPTLLRILAGREDFSKLLRPGKYLFWTLTFGLVIWAGLYFSTTPLYMFIPNLVLGRLLLVIPELFFVKFTFKKTPSGNAKLVKIDREELAGFVLIGLLLIAFFAPVSFGAWLELDRSVGNAAYFNTRISLAGDKPIFNKELPPEIMRLVTPELAASIAEQHISSFGSNMEIKGVHITIINNTLVWIAVIGSTNTFAENYIQGFVVIKATDPFADPIIVKQRFQIGEGLFLYNDIGLHSYEINPIDHYGTAYITQAPDGSWVYVITRSRLDTDFISREDGILVYNADGTIRAEYSIDNIPDWIPQMYDEDWLEEKITLWGGYRRDNSFDYWAGGFLWIQPSRDRVEISEDLRYIQSPDTGKMQGVITVHPATSDKTLAGVFVANISGIFYYDYRQFNYISGRSAINYVEGKLTQPAQGYYYGTMPLLYTVKINNVSRMVWFVPIYWAQYTSDEDEESSALIRFAGLGIVDAADPSYVIVNIDVAGKNGPQIVSDTIKQFKALFGEQIQPENEINIIATVNATYQYTLNGITHIVLQLNNDTFQFIEGTPETLNATEWYELLATKAGDTISATIQKDDSGRWIIIAFDNLNL